MEKALSNIENIYVFYGGQQSLPEGGKVLKYSRGSNCELWNHYSGFRKGEPIVVNKYF
jgi:hypothetical protein